MENGKKQGTGSQIDGMKRLNQQAASWLLNCSTRHLRNRSSSCPRNEDDTYSGQALVAWALADFVPERKLDDEVFRISAERKKTTLIKIDVEGNEVDVLKGCKKLLGLDNVIWIIECHGTEEDMEEVFDVMSEFERETLSGASQIKRFKFWRG